MTTVLLLCVLGNIVLLLFLCMIQGRQASLPSNSAYEKTNGDLPNVTRYQLVQYVV